MVLGRKKKKKTQPCPAWKGSLESFWYHGTQAWEAGGPCWIDEVLLCLRELVQAVLGGFFWDSPKSGPAADCSAQARSALLLEALLASLLPTFLGALGMAGVGKDTETSTLTQAGGLHPGEASEDLFFQRNARESVEKSQLFLFYFLFPLWDCKTRFFFFHLLLYSTFWQTLYIFFSDKKK